MNSGPDLLLNRLVVAALTVFVTVSLLLAAFVFHEIWLQRHITDLSADLQVNLDDLKQTTEEIQSDLSEILRTTVDSAQTIESLDEVTELLTSMDEQIVSIEQDIAEVTDILEPESEAVSAESQTAAEALPIPKRVSRVFMIFVVLTSIAGIAIAILLDIALQVQKQNGHSERGYFFR